jgi:multiple sugar transport system ATP-binding protein
MTVRRNLSFGLRLRRTPKARVAEQVDGVAGALGLDQLLARKPAALSGGQRQRVAMGRAIVREPRAFLMDEPLSNLDAKLRVAMRAQLAQLHARLGVTTVYVTHDQAEAMTLGQRVAILRDGVLQQCDAPERLFDAPRNLFVAAFIGSPAMNLAHAEVVDGEARFAGQRFGLPPRWTHGDHPDVVLGVRPSDFVLADAHTDPRWPRMSATATVVERLGSECFVIFGVDTPPVVTDATRAAASGDDQAALVGADGGSLFTARVDGRVRIAPGDRVELAVDRERLYVFDGRTEELLLGPAPAAGVPA